MGDQLLVRTYNVGCGDCIYVRIPNGDDHFHILIDCGSKESARTKVMERSIKHIEDEMLPEENGKKVLDLVVVSHRHEDHIKGFEPEFFENIKINHIWITAAMDETHVQAEKSQQLHGFAKNSMQTMEKQGFAMSPELEGLASLYSISNDGATDALTKKLPAQSGIDVDYVFAGLTSDDLGVTIADTMLHILGPEQDIDRFYLGEEADASLQGLLAAEADLGVDPDGAAGPPADDDGGEAPAAAAATAATAAEPTNISGDDFRVLRSRLLSNGLAFAVDDSKIQNNVSTILLIEWRNRRLLFVGDAEWEEAYKEGSKNGTWNVMWKERRDKLDAPLDFLKVGHHGSHNATPWNPDNPDSEVNEILEAILPLPPAGQEPTAQCTISTKRKQYKTIPDAELLTELGKRVSSTRAYLKDFKAEDPNFDPVTEIYNYDVTRTYSGEDVARQIGELGWLDKPQPWRSDMETIGRREKTMSGDVEFIDVLIDPGDT